MVRIGKDTYIVSKIEHRPYCTLLPDMLLVVWILVIAHAWKIHTPIAQPTASQL
jgi:hypothetical protein